MGLDDYCGQSCSRQFQVVGRHHRHRGKEEGGGTFVVEMGYYSYSHPSSSSLWHWIENRSPLEEVLWVQSPHPRLPSRSSMIVLLRPKQWKGPVVGKMHLILLICYLLTPAINRKRSPVLSSCRSFLFLSLCPCWRRGAEGSLLLL